MRFLKWLAIGVAALLALLAGVIVGGGFLLPDAGRVVRSGHVDAAPQQVHALVNDLTRIRSWSPWLAMDPAAVLTFKGPPSGVGAAYTWSSTVLGDGSYRIATSTPDSIGIDLVFGEMEPARATFTFTPKGAGTDVTWTLDTDAKGNLLSRWFNVVLDMMVGPDFEKGIANMSTPAKAIALGEVRGIEPATRPITHGLGIRSTIDAKDIAKTLATSYGTIMQYLAQKKLTMTGAPLAIYHTWDGKTTDMEAVIPIAAPDPGNGTVRAVTLGGGRYLRVTYAGPYEGSEMAHTAADTWLKANKVSATAAPFEEYVTDPGAEPDPAKWITTVWYKID
jgi:effector-binding domain-containing protein